MKTSSNKLTMVLALVLATAAAVAVYSYASSNEKQRDTQAGVTAPPTATAVPTIGVLIAKQDVAANTIVTTAMVEVRQVLPGDKNLRALSAPEEAIGKVTTVALARGEQVLSSRLTSELDENLASETFAYNVPAGKRAFSLVFDEVIGAGALVQPGDHVDIIAYFEIDVTDPTFDPSGQAAATNGGETSSDSGEGNNKNEKDVDYTQYVSSYIVQNVEVLAVAQALTPDEAGVLDPGARPTPTPENTPTPDPESTVVAAEEEEGDPVARPKAISVTLAVDADQAQRLMLAALTVKKEKGGLRLSLRAPGDNTIYDLRPAQLGEIPIGGLLGDVNRPMLPSELAITDAKFSRRVLNSGEVLDFKVTVKNISPDKTIKADVSTPPEFTYTEGEAYDTLGMFAEPGTYRLGLNVSGAYPTQYPYRWSLGRDLAPGESIDVVGSVKLHETTPLSRYWFGIILEPDVVTLDGAGVTEITVMPPSAAVVSGVTATLRAEPDVKGKILDELVQNEYLTVLEVQDDWFRVQSSDETEGWIEIEAVEVVPPASSEIGAPFD